MPGNSARCALCAWLVLPACINFDAFSEGIASSAGGASGGSPGSGGAQLGGFPSTSSSSGGYATGASSGGDGGIGGVGGMLTSTSSGEPICGDGVVNTGEECDDALGPDGACVKCHVICEGTGEFSDRGTNHCYRFEKVEELVWEKAQEACDQWREGAYLVVIESEAEQLFLDPQLAGNFFIGGEDLDDDGVWEWVTNAPMIYTNWDPAQPDDDKLSRCMGIASSGTDWHNFRCDDDRDYLCEWEPPTQ